MKGKSVETIVWKATAWSPPNWSDSRL